MNISFNELVLNFRKLGLSKGDTILVHSSYKSFGGIEGGPQTVIDAIKSILTNDGTLIVPTFNYDFCSGVPFDIKKTPSKMGIISELVRLDVDSKRTQDPVFSFGVIGKHRDYLTNLISEHSFGSDSIFAKLRELNAKIMIIGLTYNESMTFFHHVEEIHGCDYRYFKEFTGNFKNYDNSEKNIKIIIFVRDLKRGVKNAVNKMGSILEKEGIVKNIMIGKSEIKIMNVNAVFDKTTEEMIKNPHILIQIENTKE